MSKKENQMSHTELNRLEFLLEKKKTAKLTTSECTELRKLLAYEEDDANAM